MRFLSVAALLSVAFASIGCHVNTRSGGCCPHCGQMHEASMSPQPANYAAPFSQESVPLPSSTGTAPPIPPADSASYTQPLPPIVHSIKPVGLFELKQAEATTVTVPGLPVIEQERLPAVPTVTATRPVYPR